MKETWEIITLAYVFRGLHVELSHPTHGTIERFIEPEDLFELLEPLSSVIPWEVEEVEQGET